MKPNDPDSSNENEPDFSTQAPTTDNVSNPQPAPPQTPLMPAAQQQVVVTTDPGKSLSIIGLILAFVLAPVGLILSIIGWRKSRKAGFGGRLGLLGATLAIVCIVLGLLLVGGLAKLLEENKPINTSNFDNPFSFYTTDYTEGNDTLELTNYQDTTYGVKFKIPKTWVAVRRTIGDETSTYIVPPGVKNDPEFALESISLNCYTYPTGPRNNKDFYDAAEKLLTERAHKRPEFESISNQVRTTINGNPAFQQEEFYDWIIIARAAPGLPSGEKLYRTMYLIKPSKVCSFYVDFVAYKESASRLILKADEIAKSFDQL